MPAASIETTDNTPTIPSPDSTNPATSTGKEDDQSPEIIAIVQICTIIIYIAEKKGIKSGSNRISSKSLRVNHRNSAIGTSTNKL